jgi:hypothetical protein
MRKPRTRPSRAARAQFAEEIDRVGRDAEQKRRAGLLEPVDQAGAAREVVHHKFAAGRQCGDQRAEPEIVAERAQRVEHRALQMPVARHHPGGGEEGVVAVEDAFRGAGRARSERQIHHLVGVAARRRGDGGSGQPGERRGVGRTDAPGNAQKVAVGEFGEDVVPAVIGAMAGLGDQRGGAHAVDQRHHFASGVAAVQGRAADIGVARAGDERDRGLDPARQPHRDALSRVEALSGEARGQPVSRLDQRPVGQAAVAVAHREGVGGLPRVARSGRVQRLLAPIPGRGIGGQIRRVEQCQQGAGHGSGASFETALRASSG